MSDYVNNRDPFDFSTRRLQIILDLIQDTIVYFVLSLVFGILIEKLFFPETIDVVKSRSIEGLIFLICLQLIFDAVSIYYITLLAESLTRWSNIGPHSSGQRSSDASIVGSIIIALVFIGAQGSLVLRIRELVRRLSL